MFIFPPFLGYYFIIHSNETPGLVTAGLKILMRMLTCSVPASSLVKHRCFTLTASLGSAADRLSGNHCDWSCQLSGGISALAKKVSWRSLFSQVEWEKDGKKWK